ncbi:hypothetical protein EJB05_14197 [Eragrostis curvula]|uniref:Cleavage/polyadenylation specificity factor A subunit N-terminal domain-containing protein n=1 Tax=Eragrostis curvula TaxID=38414 RepID=A0A5J9VZI6_9POAL|nr:hypothetical protein EJB05_14197 [Eragrostis curvula]
MFEILIAGVDSVDLPNIEKQATLVGNKLYFPATLRRSEERILEFDLEHSQLSSIDPPILRPTSSVLMPVDGGGLGFVCMYGSRLLLWARKAGLDGTLSWVLRSTFDLSGRFSLSEGPLDVVGYTDTEGLGAILLRTGTAVFKIDLNSRRIKKLSSCIITTCAVIPYTSFYTRDQAHSEKSSSENDWRKKRGFMRLRKYCTRRNIDKGER